MADDITRIEGRFSDLQRELDSFFAEFKTYRDESRTYRTNTNDDNQEIASKDDIMMLNKRLDDIVIYLKSLQNIR